MVEATTITKANTSKPTLPPDPAQTIRQKYEESKLELKGLLSRKKQVDQNLINLEHAIYLFEGSYLEDTQQNGNIIRGFEGYLSNRQDRKRPKSTELDRLFSLSSSTYQRAVAQKDERDQESSQDDTASAFTRKEKKRRLKMESGEMHTKKKKRFEDDSSVIFYED